MENNFKKTKTQNKTRDMAFTGMLIALVFATTRFINIPMPANGGLVHIGDIMLFTVTIVFGRKKGAIAGAFGMGIFDLLSPYAVWAPFTFVIRGVMGLIIGSVAYSRGKNGENVILNIVGILIASVWMIGGYYAAEGIIYGNWIAPVASIPGNILQLTVGLLGIPLSIVLKRAFKKTNLI